MGNDHHEGQRVSRRTAIAGIGSVGLGALLAACSGSKSGGGASAQATTTTGASATVPPQATTDADLTGLFENANTCTLTPETTQGPYYFDADKIRSDIREDREGVQLRLAIRVQDSETCQVIPNAVVEIWHCDAAGLYSGAESLSGGGSGGGGGPGGGRDPAVRSPRRQRRQRRRRRPHPAGRQALPARRPGHQQRRDRAVHHHLARLVPGPDGARPRDGPRQQRTHPHHPGDGGRIPQTARSSPASRTPSTPAATPSTTATASTSPPCSSRSPRRATATWA